MPFDGQLQDFQPQPVRLVDLDPKTIIDPKERLMYLRDFLRERALPHEFDMTDWHCGSAACIGGWIENFWFSERLDEGVRVPDREVGEAIGIYDGAWHDLFYPIGEHSDGRVYCSRHTTAREAANVLDHLIQTGEVDWSKA